MEYRQTPLALISRAITSWWWLGMITLGGSIIFDVMNYRRSKLVLNESSIAHIYGVLTQNSQELPYKNIQAVSINQSVLGRLLDYGQIVITTANATDPIDFKYVANPNMLKQEIQSRIS